VQNYVEQGDFVTVPAPADVTSGEGVVVGTALFGVAAADALSGTPVALGMRGVYTLPKTSALAIAIGDLLYWNDGTKTLTKTNTDMLVGVAVSAAANPSPTVNVRLAL
jgi:predicted RecA/RadA family phage recombinase